MNKSCLPILLLLGLLLSGCDAAPEKEGESTTKNEVSMEKHYVFVGTYTRKEGHVDGKAKGIYVLQWEESQASLSTLDTLTGLPNPSYINLHPDGKYLYAANELADGSEEVLGQVSAFSIDPVNRSYQQLSNVSAMGDAPCHVAVLGDKSHAVVANYVDGNVAVLPINSDGSLGEAVAEGQHEGKGQPLLQVQVLDTWIFTLPRTTCMSLVN